MGKEPENGIFERFLSRKSGFEIFGSSGRRNLNLRFSKPVSVKQGTLDLRFLKVKTGTLNLRFLKVVHTEPEFEIFQSKNRDSKFEIFETCVAI